MSDFMPDPISAYYGPKNVTDLIKQLERKQDEVKVSNDTLGGDPAPGVYKYLSVQYPDLTVRIAGEHQILKFKSNRVKSAFYCFKDVTEKVKELQKTKGIIVVSNDLFGDPAPGVLKYLCVQYEDLSTRIAAEKQSIKLN